MNERSATPLSKFRKGAIWPQKRPTNKKRPRRVSSVNSLCTLRGPQPLNRENTCPRWDSNRTPALANAGLPPKHTESGPVRHRYGPVRDL